MKTCGKCGEQGHNARTCKKKGAAPAKKPAKKAAGVSSPSADATNTTVTESLVARQTQLKKELAVIERVLSDLNEVGIS